jgi:hypothetical protein
MKFVPRSCSFMRWQRLRPRAGDPRIRAGAIPSCSFSENNYYYMLPKRRDFPDLVKSAPTRARLGRAVDVVAMRRPRHKTKAKQGS